MMRTYQFACILSVSHVLEDRQSLVNFVFDDINCDLSQDYKSIYDRVYPIIDNVCALHSAHVVGRVPLNSKLQKSPDRTTFVYSCLCPPGKHSVFVFLPETQTFYKKVIVVEPQQKALINRKSIIDAEQTESKLQDKKQKTMSSYHYFLNTVNKETNTVS